MPLLSFLPLILALAFCLVPVLLLRQPTYGRAQDYFVACENTPPEVIQNASIASTLALGTFVPFFVAGASGDFWPAIISAVSFGSGVALIHLVRRPILAFIADALKRDGSVSVHAFIARQYGNDPRVHLLAAALTVLALSTFLVAVACALSMLLKPVIPGGAGYLLIGALFLLTALAASVGGNSGVLRAGQTLLGVCYFCLFAATALLLFIVMSPRMPPHGILAVVMVALCCIVMLAYRRSRYIDASPIGMRAGDDYDQVEAAESSGFRLFRRVAKILNVCISVVVVTVTVFALMQLYAYDVSALMRECAAALASAPRVSGWSLAALILLPLCYPLVDITNWQRMAAFEQNAAWRDPASGHAATLAKVFRVYAIESTLMWLLVTAFATLAVLAMAMPDNANVMQSFLQQLVEQDNFFMTTLAVLLLVALFALALAAMSAAGAAILCALRYDIVPSFCPELAAERAPPATQAQARRRALIVAGGLLLITAVVALVLDAAVPARFPGGALLALLFAIVCAQLSFVPLVLGPVLIRSRRDTASVGAGWALGIMATGIVISLSAVTASLLTGNGDWLCAAVPACLGSGCVIFAMARL